MLTISDFGEFPKAATALNLDKTKPLVIFCTGGIRCEKAGLFMQQQGFERVYQLEGGILQYFADEGGDFYRGHCFVFDDREALTPELGAIKSEFN